jgi:hypothetical protein
MEGRLEKRAAIEETGATASGLGNLPADRSGLAAKIGVATNVRAIRREAARRCIAGLLAKESDRLFRIIAALVRQWNRPCLDSRARLSDSGAPAAAPADPGSRPAMRTAGTPRPPRERPQASLRKGTAMRLDGDRLRTRFRRCLGWGRRRGSPIRLDRDRFLSHEGNLRVGAGTGLAGRLPMPPRSLLETREETVSLRLRSSLQNLTRPEALDGS